MTESPELFRNVANSSLSQTYKLNSSTGAQGTPLRSNLKGKPASRPSSAQQRAKGLAGVGQGGQGSQGIQSNSSKLRLLQEQELGDKHSSPTNPISPQAVQAKSTKISNVVTKFSFATKGGIAAHNPYKTNQDAYITSPHIMGLKHCHFFSVCDGHGQNGREVSGLLKHRLPFHVEN